MSSAIAFAIPLLPGTTEAARAALRSCWLGDRTTAYEASRRRLGITGERVWFQSTPGGDVAVAVVEAADIHAALAGVSSSPAPFEVWFRDHCRAVHGVDLEAGLPMPELVLDYRAPGVGSATSMETTAGRTAQ